MLSPFYTVLLLALVLLGRRSYSRNDVSFAARAFEEQPLILLAAMLTRTDGQYPELTLQLTATLFNVGETIPRVRDFGWIARRQARQLDVRVGHPPF